MTLGPMTLRADQAGAVAAMSEEFTRAALNISPMSAGKTAMAVELAKELAAQVILVIAPLNSWLGWKVTFERQGVTLPFMKMNSTKSGQEAFASWANQEPGIYFIGPELFARRGWKDGRRSKVWTTVTPDLAIFDEVHRAQSRKSLTYKTLMQVRAGYKHALSGTPTGNSFEGAYAPTHWLWPEEVDVSFARWKDTWCETEFDPFSYDRKRIIGEKNPGAYFNSLPCVVKIEPKIDVEIDEDVRYVDLSRNERRIYSTLEDQGFVWLTQEAPLVAELPITLRIRLRQGTLGALSLDEDGGVVYAEDCESSKLDEMFDILDNEYEGESCLIFCESAKFVRVTVARLQAAGHEAREWSGSVTQKQRTQITEDFIAGRVKYVVAVIPAAAEAIDGWQHATRNVLWLSKSDSRILNEQGLARVMRTGQTRLVRSREIVAVNTLDDGVLSKQLRDALEMRKVLQLR